MGEWTIGILGGSGLYEMEALEEAEWVRVETPWGPPSDALLIGRLHGTRFVFLPRHGRGHRIPPTQVNARANVDALKRAGCTDLVAVSAVGSLREELAPGRFVLVDQFVDRTYKRESSFFGAGCVAHVSMAHPVGPRLQQRIAEAASAEGIEVTRGGTYVCMEGPQFSSLAESLAYKAAAYDVIGMTNMPEAKLAREAEITYATIAMVTDYDCWHPEHEAVDVADVIAVARANADRAARLVSRLARDFPAAHEPCPAKSDRALETAIMTAPSARDPALLAKLDAVAGRVLAPVIR
jgi:5'-methylthioadenosine phosphorylase